MYVRVAVNIPTDKTFSYSVPDPWSGEALPGRLVLVPFGKKIVTGYIVETDASADVDNIRQIVEIPAGEPYFSEADLLFYRWVSEYYLYPLGKTLFDILPTPVAPKKEKVVSLTSPCFVGEDRLKMAESTHASGPPNGKLSAPQGLLLSLLRERGATSISDLREEFGNASYLVGCLQKKGLVILEEREVYRAGRLPAETMAQRVSLNEDQKNAVRDILPGLRARRFSPFLLHGVTGSGKTEVYLRLLEAARERGGGVISLVPEIALTPQLIARVMGRFRPEEVAVIHSGVSRSVRHDQWRKIQRGEVKIVVGARSALFVPMPDLRLIIVDEEHDGSYKQDERLRYNARDMAVVKAKLNGATVILGSATPSLQTYFNARKKKYSYLALPKRIENRALPAVKIVDMRTAREENSELPILSRTLKEEMSATLAEGKQILLFLNRRGFDTVVLCPDCGYVFKCLNCEITLTHHAGSGILQCHCCDYAIKTAFHCPACHGERLRSYGLGTEKLEEEVKRIFPRARVGRMDSDSTGRRGEAERILRMLAKQELDILVGTQMIVKGHDFPAITLVGVVAADLSLNVPDFRSGEKTFQMLTQVAGRGGRGKSPGLVIVQTFNPDHYAVRRAQQHDYQGFYEDEIKLRKNLHYPPYDRLVNLHISCVSRDRGKAGIEKIGLLAKNMASAPRTGGHMEILGPAAAPIAKIKGRYRWQLLLKSSNIPAQNSMVEAIRAEAKKRGLEVKVDVDPMNFM